MTRTARLDQRHAMHEFGTVYGATPEVRVNRLENRLDPQVPFPHRHDFYHLVIVISGGGWHEIDFWRYPVRSHQIFFMKPGQVHSWRLSARTSGYVVEFGNEVALEISRGSYAAVSPERIADHIDLTRAPVSQRSSVQTLLGIMLGEYERQATDFEIALRHYLIPLLITLARLGHEAKRPESRKTDDPLLVAFFRLIEEHFRKEHEVTFYSRQLKTTSKALTMRVSRAVGRSARGVIQDRCLLEAQRLLAYSNLAIAEIGYELGFEDPNYFSRFFRKMTGVTPGAFRVKARPAL